MWSLVPAVTGSWNPLLAFILLFSQDCKRRMRQNLNYNIKYHIYNRILFNRQRPLQRWDMFNKLSSNFLSSGHQIYWFVTVLSKNDIVNVATRHSILHSRQHDITSKVYTNSTVSTKQIPASFTRIEFPKPGILFARGSKTSRFCSVSILYFKNLLWIFCFFMINSTTTCHKACQVSAIYEMIYYTYHNTYIAHITFTCT